MVVCTPISSFINSNFKLPFSLQCSSKQARFISFSTKFKQVLFLTIYIVLILTLQWIDIASVKIMWARESLEDGADYILSKADKVIDFSLDIFGILKLRLEKRFSFIIRSWEWIFIQYSITYDNITNPIVPDNNAKDESSANVSIIRIFINQE